MRLQKQYCYVITLKLLSFFFTFHFAHLPKIHASIPLNTKYLKLMMRIEDYQSLNQDYYFCVCVCDNDLD